MAPGKKKYLQFSWIWILAFIIFINLPAFFARDSPRYNHQNVTKIDGRYNFDYRFYFKSNIKTECIWSSNAEITDFSMQLYGFIKESRTFEDHLKNNHQQLEKLDFFVKKSNFSIK